MRGFYTPHYWCIYSDLFFLASTEDPEVRGWYTMQLWRKESRQEEGKEEGSQASELNPFEMLDPVDILSKMEKDFYEQVMQMKPSNLY